MPNEDIQFKLARIINEGRLEVSMSPMVDQLVWGVGVRYEDSGEIKEVRAVFFQQNNCESLEALKHLKRPNREAIANVQRLCAAEVALHSSTSKALNGASVPTALEAIGKLDENSFPWFVDVSVHSSGVATFERPSAESMFKALVEQYSRPGNDEMFSRVLARRAAREAAAG